MYPVHSEYHNLEELKQTIDNRMNFHNDYINPDFIVSKETQKHAELMTNFLVKY